MIKYFGVNAGPKVEGMTWRDTKKISNHEHVNSIKWAQSIEKPRTNQEIELGRSDRGSADSRLPLNSIELTQPIKSKNSHPKNQIYREVNHSVEDPIKPIELLESSVRVRTREKPSLSTKQLEFALNFARASRNCEIKLLRGRVWKLRGFRDLIYTYKIYMHI